MSKLKLVPKLMLASNIEFESELELEGAMSYDIWGKGSARPDTTHPVSRRDENSRIPKDPEGWQPCKLSSDNMIKGTIELALFIFCILERTGKEMQQTKVSRRRGKSN